MRWMIAAICSILIFSSLSIASTSGKITGHVTLEDTKESAVSASVLILELKIGAKTDFEGNYTILNVPPGTYTLRFSYVGYRSVKIDSVIITSGVTFTQNVTLKAESVQRSEIVIKAEPPKVQLDVTGGDKITRRQDIDRTSASSVQDGIYKKSGVKIDNDGALHVRGGRRGESAVVQGTNTGDPMAGSAKERAQRAVSRPDKMPPYYPPPYRPTPGRDNYARINENPFISVNDEPLSTFSIDVDNASYSNVRSFLMAGNLPPMNAVRLEEMINYFSYNYPEPKDEHPCSITTNLAECPWDDEHYLLRVGLKAKSLDQEEVKPNNLVFLLDVSGSMADENKLPLVKRAFRLLANQLRHEDHIAIVTYSTTARIALSSTRGDRLDDILSAIDGLAANGSTAGAQGIQLAYQVAADNFLENGTNRVIIATDGDFNVGVSDDNQLLQMIKQKRKSNIFLSILGVGRGNLQDAKMELLADNGNGHYYYIDTFNEARKVFLEQLYGTLVTVAKDVKVQIEFNPAKVIGYRLIGYENRLLAAEDFNNDRVDAGEMGAGHTVTALYEIVPVGADNPFPSIDSLRYQQTEPEPQHAWRKTDKEWLFVKVRYKEPDEKRSNLIEHPVTGTPVKFANSPSDMQFAVAVAEFGMLLRNSPYGEDIDYTEVKKLARHNLGEDPAGIRHEFLRMIEAAEEPTPGNR